MVGFGEPGVWISLDSSNSNYPGKKLHFSPLSNCVILIFVLPLELSQVDAHHAILRVSIVTAFGLLQSSSTGSIAFVPIDHLP